MDQRTSFLTDIKTLRERARRHIEQGAITESYRADRETVVRLLNEALATEIVCVLRYRRHYFMAVGINADAVATEFLEHANEEQQHADQIAARIVQLNGEPDFNPEGLATRSHAEYVEGASLEDMIKEDLVAERIAIDSYREIIEYLGDRDTTTKRMMEEILAVEEEHADDLVGLLEKMKYIAGGYRPHRQSRFARRFPPAVPSRMREGNLEAPTRHPLDWKSEAFYDEGKTFAEMERIFDICHGCRRCVNLCTAFPTLFDLVDESKTLEIDGVAKQDYWKVVDQCYLCDTCYMTKCPYVPPHPWNVDFPHVMLRAKAVKLRQQGAKFRDKLLSSTDAMGKLSTIPVVVQTVNAVNKNGFSRALIEKTLGVHRDRELPEYAKIKFRSGAEKSKDFPVKDGKDTPGKVVIFSTCYVNYNEPGMGHDLLAVLEHNEIPYVLLEQEACCGMPKLELGDLDAVAFLKEKNIPEMSRLAREGYAILTPVPSCTLMFKQELPLMFPKDEDVAAVREAMFDPFEYFVLRKRDGLLKTDFRQPLGKVSYHIPCHSRVQNVGQKTRELLETVPGTTLTTIERCAGHDGTWGVKKEYYENSMKIGRPVFRQMAEPGPDWVSSDCPIAGRHIMQGMGEEKKDAQKAHPLSLLRKAYGL